LCEASAPPSGWIVPRKNVSAPSVLDVRRAVPEDLRGLDRHAGRTHRAQPPVDPQPARRVELHRDQPDVLIRRQRRQRARRVRQRVDGQRRAGHVQKTRPTEQRSHPQPPVAGASSEHGELQPGQEGGPPATGHGGCQHADQSRGVALDPGPPLHE
jgi:hypothetical protein